jgi:hypothetical protein
VHKVLVATVAGCALLLAAAGVAAADGAGGGDRAGVLCGRSAPSDDQHATDLSNTGGNPTQVSPYSGDLSGVRPFCGHDAACPPRARSDRTGLVDPAPFDSRRRSISPPRTSPIARSPSFVPCW